jgi:hypothetical protein
MLCLQNSGEDVSGEELHEILREIDTNMNGQVELDEYLQVRSASLQQLHSYCLFHKNLI